MVQIIAIIIGLYLLGEAIAAASQMERGDRFCRLSKYLLLAIVGLALIFESKSVDTWHLVMAITLALFVWPKMKARIEHTFEILIGD